MKYLAHRRMKFLVLLLGFSIGFINPKETHSLRLFQYFLFLKSLIIYIINICMTHLLIYRRHNSKHVMIYFDMEIVAVYSYDMTSVRQVNTKET